MQRWFSVMLLAVVLVLPAPAHFLVKADEKKPLKEDVEATRLLKEARQARANWDHFPGFSADIEVNHNGKVVRGLVEVSGKGNVTVKLNDDKLKAWTLRQLRSLVEHRIGTPAERDTPCAFLDDQAEHPLGRAISVLNDELHSSYRIRHRQIIEVCRTMKDTRFIITVLENSETPEKTFLPRSYVVNTWNIKTNQLVSSVAHTNQWTRVGKFDLPAQLRVVEAKGQSASGTTDARPASPPLQAWAIRFSNHKLLVQ